MFLPIDLELFPEDCRVVYMPSCDQWIYWIQKNGSSSLKKEWLVNGYPLKVNNEVADLREIHLYIRDPKDRYISGCHTYLEFLIRDHPNLDRSTALWFVKKYKFLNRHYMPQFYWLVSLSRFISRETILHFHRLEELKAVTPYRYLVPDINPIPDNFADELLDGDRDIEFWFYIDQILFDLAGNSKNWKELLEHYQQNHPNAWDFVSKQIKPHVLS